MKSKIRFTQEGGFYEHRPMRLVSLELDSLSIWPGSSFPGGWQLTWEGFNFCEVEIFPYAIEIKFFLSWYLLRHIFTWSTYGIDGADGYCTHRLCIIRLFGFKLWLDLGEINRTPSLCRESEET